MVNMIVSESVKNGGGNCFPLIVSIVRSQIIILMRKMIVHCLTQFFGKFHHTELLQFFDLRITEKRKVVHWGVLWLTLKVYRLGGGLGGPQCVT